MSYIHAVDLQELIYDSLSQDPAMNALVGTSIFDVPPQGDVPLIYVVLGPEEVRDVSDQLTKSTIHMLTISVVTHDAGFRQAKKVAEAVTKRLDGMTGDFGQSYLTRMQFQKARARRVNGGRARQIDLTFRARIDEVDQTIHQEI